MMRAIPFPCFATCKYGHLPRYDTPFRLTVRFFDPDLILLIPPPVRCTFFATFFKILPSPVFRSDRHFSSHPQRMIDCIDPHPVPFFGVSSCPGLSPPNMPIYVWESPSFRSSRYPPHPCSNFSLKLPAVSLLPSRWTDFSPLPHFIPLPLYVLDRHSGRFQFHSRHLVFVIP